MDEFIKRYNELSESTGKLLISLSTGTIVVTLTFITDINLQNPINVKWALMLGWCLELYHNFIQAMKEAFAGLTEVTIKIADLSTALLSGDHQPLRRR